MVFSQIFFVSFKIALVPEANGSIGKPINALRLLTNCLGASVKPAQD